MICPFRLQAERRGHYKWGPPFLLTYARFGRTQGGFSIVVFRFEGDFAVKCGENNSAFVNGGTIGGIIQVTKPKITYKIQD